MKRKLYILILILGMFFSAEAQRTVLPAPQVKYLKFFPNPASSFISFDFQKGYDNTHSLQVFSFMGKKVYDLKNIPALIRINLDDFYRGIYIFQLRDKNGRILESGKFQVIK